MTIGPSLILAIFVSLAYIPANFFGTASAWTVAMAISVAWLLRVQLAGYINQADSITDNVVRRSFCLSALVKSVFFIAALATTGLLIGEFLLHYGTYISQAPHSFRTLDDKVFNALLAALATGDLLPPTQYNTLTGSQLPLLTGLMLSMCTIPAVAIICFSPVNKIINVITTPTSEVRSIAQSNTANAAFGLHMNLIWIATLFCWLFLLTYIEVLLTTGIRVTPIRAAAFILGCILIAPSTWIVAPLCFYRFKNGQY